MNQTRNHPFAGRTDMELEAQIEWVERHMEGLRREHAAMVEELGRRRAGGWGRIARARLGYDDPSLMGTPMAGGRIAFDSDDAEERAYAARARRYALRLTLRAMGVIGTVAGLVAAIAWVNG